MKNKKELGQNWLNNRAILEEIAELATCGGAESAASGAKSVTGGAKSAVYDGDLATCGNGGSATCEEVSTCVEIGPGLGTLTTSLLRRFKKVIAVEYDARLAANLPKSFPGKNLEVVNEDILQFDFSTVREKYVIAGNIPYYITSPILEKVLYLENPPQKIVLLIQKEVAERIVDEKATLLSLMVKNRAEAWAGPVVNRAEFTPPPKVDSQVLVLVPKKSPVVPEAVLDLARRGFRAPRKKLVHNLADLKSREELLGILRELGISENARPGDLSLENWQQLWDRLNGARQITEVNIDKKA